MPGVVWVLMGVFGLAGGVAGDLMRRFGINVIHRVFLVILALATLVLGLFPSSPAVGLGLPFLMIATGQVLGAPVAGTLIRVLGYGATFMVFAGVALSAMLAGCRSGTRAIVAAGPEIA